MSNNNNAGIGILPILTLIFITLNCVAYFPGVGG